MFRERRSARNPAALGISWHHNQSLYFPVWVWGAAGLSPKKKTARPEDILPPMASFSTASCFWRFTACNSWGIHNNRWCLVSEIIHFWGWSTVDGSWPKPRSLVSKSPVSSHVCPTFVVRPVLVLGVPQPFPVFLLGLGGCTAKTYGKALEKNVGSLDGT